MEVIMDFKVFSQSVCVKLLTTKQMHRQENISSLAEVFTCLVRMLEFPKLPGLYPIIYV